LYWGQFNFGRIIPKEPIMYFEMVCKNSS
jgi:hypothetical protein